MMPNKVKRRRKIQTESGVSRQLTLYVYRCYWIMVVMVVVIINTIAVAVGDVSHSLSVP